MLTKPCRNFNHKIRLENSALIALDRSVHLVAPHSLVDHEPIDPFPRTVSELLRLSAEQCGQILRHLRLPEDGNLVNKRKRILHEIGVYMTGPGRI